MTWWEDHVADERVSLCTLVKIGFGTPLYLTDRGHDVYFDGHLWKNYPYTVSGLSSMQFDKAGGSIQVGDGDNVVGALVLAANGASGVAVEVYEARFDIATATGVPNATRVMYAGSIDTVTMRADQVAIQLGPMVGLDSKLIPRRHVSTLFRSTP